MNRKSLFFKKNDVEKVLNSVGPDDEIMIVGDQGIYLMSDAEKVRDHTVAYAEGCNPLSNVDWYLTKRSTYGGDDGVDSIGSGASVRKILEGCANHLVIELRPTQLIVTTDSA